MKKVNKYTRAGKEGRTIYCPECNAPSKVYHFSWSAITCGGCQQMIGKYYFSVEPRQFRSNQGRSPQQIENSYKAIEWSFFGLIITTVIYSLGKALGIW